MDLRSASLRMTGFVGGFSENTKSSVGIEAHRRSLRSGPTAPRGRRDDKEGATVRSSVVAGLNWSRRGSLELEVDEVAVAEEAEEDYGV
jgi:hypothetical protein